VWIDHLKTADPELASHLERNEVLCHPWVRGELALGSLRNREEFLGLLAHLPEAHEVPTIKVLAIVNEHRLFSRGIGWVDAQLLATCLSWPCRLWTHDKKLALVARELGIASLTDILGR
jgi:predicted nucleic acid-binding protein